MLKHHDTAEKESSRVGKTLASNVRSGSVDGFEDGTLIANVTRGSETETTDQTGTHVGENVTVQVGHDKNLVIVRDRIGGDVQASVIQQLRIEFDVGELLGDISGKVKEKTVRHLHDGGLVNHADLLLVDCASVLERVAKHSFRRLLCDELNALHNTRHNNMFDARVFTLCVLTDQDRVDIIVGCLVASNGLARTHVSKKVEGTAQRQVERNVALANRGLEKRRESACHYRRGARRKGRNTASGPLRATKLFFTLWMASSGMTVLPSFNWGVTSAGSHLMGTYMQFSSLFSFHSISFQSSALLRTRRGGEASVYICCGEDVLDRLGNFGSNTIALNQRHRIFSLSKSNNVKRFASNQLFRWEDGFIRQILSFP